MTRALVVYESMFGNTERIAHAVADGLAGLDVDCVHVSQAPPAIPVDLDLLVVGGPTHALSLSRPGTRAGAAQQGQKENRHVDSSGPGVREWLEGLGRDGDHTLVATFDTKFRKAPGSAARAAARRLRRKGARAVTPASFYVIGSTGPLRDGEEQRAHAWAATLASRFAAQKEMAR